MNYKYKSERIISKWSKKKISLVIFDLDGVLVNSEPLHENAKRRILSEAGIVENIDLSWSIGKPNKELWTILIDKFKLSKSPEELEETQYNYILQEIEEKQIAPTEGLVNLLSWLKENNIKIGLASSSNRFYVLAILAHYEIINDFNYIVAGDDVARKKPSPDAYLKVLELNGGTASGVIAIEDSSAGSEAAILAGLQCIGYLNPTSGQQDLSKCFELIRSIEEVMRIVEAG